MTTLIQPDLFATANDEPDHLLLVDTERQELLIALRRNVSLLNELAIRYEVETRPHRSPKAEQISTSNQVFDLLRAEMTPLAQEQVRVLLLDRQLRVLGQRTIYQGNAYSALVDRRKSSVPRSSSRPRASSWSTTTRRVTPHRARTTSI